MPYIIDDVSFARELDITTNNYSNTKEFLNKGIKDYNLSGLAVTPGYRFVQIRRGEEYRLIYNTSTGWLTLYAVKVILQAEITFPNAAATQVMVWRSPSLLHKTILENITHLFFINLLTKMKIVISDAEQTVHGMRFWKRMLEWAFYSGYYIYVADGSRGEDWVRASIKTHDEFCMMWENFAWGKDKDVHQHRRLIVSKHEIVLSEKK